MKRIYLLILCAGLITVLYAQSPIIDRNTINISSLLGFPLILGDTETDRLQVSANKLLPMDVELDSMSRHQIGAIPNQTVWHEGDITVGFYVLTDTLQDASVTLSYSMDFPPKGKVTFNDQTGRFKYFPDKFDARSFTVTFKAQSESKIIVQDVIFTLMPATPPEYAAFGVEPAKPMPASTDDYTIVSQTIKRNVQLNNIVRDTVYSFSITGKELVFDSQLSNKLRYLNGRNDLYELNLFAEKVIIREALFFPQTNVTIYAKQLVFQDLPGQQAASIHTSPMMFDVLSENIGLEGAKAGNITLYIQDYKQSASWKRFVSVGGKGQNVPWTTEQTDRKPGKGGNGGILTSTIDVSEFCDLRHGSAGIQIDKQNRIIGVGEPGDDGHFIRHEKKFTWLHPNFITAVVKQAKDAYLNMYNGYTYTTFTEYTQYLSDLKASEEWNDLDDEAKMELTNAENEMQALLFRINQNLDFFGNPVGWVPMLSFEVNKMAFEQEIDKAIRVMYLSYWLRKIEGSNEERINACNEAIKLVKQDLADNKDLVNQFVRLIPELQDEATALEQMIDDLALRIEQKTRELLAKAKSNVKKQNKYNKISGILSAVARVAPVVCSVVPGLGTAIGMGISSVMSAGNTVLSKVTNASDTYGYADAVGGFFDLTKSLLQSGGGFSTITNALNGIDISSLGSTYNTVDEAYGTINKTVAPLVKSVEKLHKAFAQSSTPNDQVQAELNKLKAESVEYQALIAEAEVLNTRKVQLMSKLANTFDGITTASVSIQKNIAAVDGLGRDVFANNSKRDLRAMQYLDDMDRRARERLLKYHYYMGKSYEYRLLKPYTAELNLSAMMDRFVAIAETNPNKPILDAQDFENLKAVYEEQLSTITANILNEYNTNRPEVTSPIRFSLTANDLAELNAERGINLNIFERGMVPPSRENVRIVSFKIHEIKAHLVGEQNPSFASFELLLQHTGLSMMRKNGEIYYFNHINNQNQNPITWGITYDAKYGIVDEQKPSSASESLLYSLLEKLGKKDEIMIYSRPGAWADIHITKNNIVSSQTKMVIDDLTFELQLDFSQRPSNNRNLDVHAGDVDNASVSLSPLITASRPDKNSRSNGRGTFYRTYNSGTTLNLEAPKDYGCYKFDNWTDQYGTVITREATVSANMSSDTWLKANYKYLGPILSTPDTIFIAKEAQVIAVKVENKGSEEMEWTSVCNIPWLKIISGDQGIDTDYITMEVERNSSDQKRSGSLIVTAPETAEYSKELTVIQSNGELTGLEQVDPSTSVKIIRKQGTDNYSVFLDETAHKLSVDVYSMNGQLVLNKYFYGTATFDFDLSHCSQGVYLVKIMYDGACSTQKVRK